MILLNPEKITGVTAILIDGAGNDVTVGPANGLDNLVLMTLEYIAAYDSASNGEYSKPLRDRATEAGDSFPVYIKRILVNQICKRYRGRVKCMRGGRGDDLHALLGKVGSLIAIAPERVKKAARAVIKKLTKGSETLGDCNTCGGTTKINRNVDNLGRVDKVNRFFGRRR